jgi:hypothetical protein
MSFLQGLLAMLLFLICGYSERQQRDEQRPLKTGLPTQSLRSVLAECRSRILVGQ